MPNNLCFSSDSSLLAISFGHTLTTWLPDTCELKCSLLHTSQQHRAIIDIAFGSGKQCHLFVSVTKKEVSVWNLLTLSMIWTVAVEVTLLVADPITSHIALFTRDNKSKLVGYPFTGCSSVNKPFLIHCSQKTFKSKSFYFYFSST